MKNKILFALIVIGVMIDILSIIGFIYIYLDGGYYYDKEVKCYDRYMNEIVGMKCIDEEFKYNSEYLIHFFTGGLVIGSFIAIASAHIINDKYYKRRYM